MDCDKALTRRRCLSTAALLSVCLFIASCGGSSTSASSAGSSYDGQWIGTTSQGMTIAFSVSNRTVTTLALGLNAAGCSGTKTINQSLAIGPSAEQLGPAGQPTFTSGPVTLSDGTLLFINGIFDSFATASGIAAHSGCAGGVPPVTVSLTWSATKR
jgi:hypothetical protein